MTTTPEAPASTAAAMDALDQRLSQRFIALDPSGYFLIKLDRMIPLGGPGLSSCCLRQLCLLYPETRDSRALG